jgi:hypothetical protein
MSNEQIASRMGFRDKRTISRINGQIYTAWGLNDTTTDEKPYQDHGAFVVFGPGPPTVAATVYAEEGEPAEAALAPAMAVAEAIAAKLP